MSARKDTKDAKDTKDTNICARCVHMSNASCSSSLDAAHKYTQAAPHSSIERIWCQTIQSTMSTMSGFLCTGESRQKLPTSSTTNNTSAHSICMSNIACHRPRMFCFSCKERRWNCLRQSIHSKGIAVDCQDLCHLLLRRGSLNSGRMIMARSKKEVQTHTKTRCSPRTRMLTRMYVNGTDVETHGYAVTQNTFLQ